MYEGKKWNALAILHVLMAAGDYVSTDEIATKVGCNRKTVYNSVDILEVNGFGIDVICTTAKNGKKNQYKYIGMYGL